MNNMLTEYVLKHGKKRDEELKYDFMPSLLEIIERPAHKAGTVIIIGIFTLLIGAIVWACVSKIDVVITANGSVQPIGNLNVVKAYSGGTVKSINVAEGEYVNQGDVLIELDAESLEIDVSQLQNQQKILEAQREIYKKIINGSDLSEVKINGYSDELKPHIQAILDSDTGYKNSLANYENEKSAAEINKEIAQLQLEQYRIGGTARQIKTQELSVQQYALAVENAELKISNVKAQYRSQLNSNISEIDSKLSEIRANLEKYRLSTEYLMITAPVSGYVNSIDVNTPGETVTAAQQLVTIVPDNTPSEVICYVKNTDVADIKVGMEAEIKLDAYPYNRYGTVKGTVKYISPSSFSNEQIGSVYIVKLEIDGANKNINIISGLSGAVEIKIGKRTVMDYFLEPIVKGFGDSLKEK